MSKIHMLKIENRWFKRLISEAKKAEIRFDNRDFQVGDQIGFYVLADHENAKDFTSPNKFIITHVLHSDVCDGLKPGFCVLSIKEQL